MHAENDLYRTRRGVPRGGSPARPVRARNRSPQRRRYRGRLRGVAGLLDLPRDRRSGMVRTAAGRERGRGGHARPRLWPDRHVATGLPDHHHRGTRRVDRAAAVRDPQHAAAMTIPGKLYGRLVDAAGNAWPAYTRHEFVLRLARGDLPEAAFRRYLVQDYLFLLHFARAWGLAVYKSDTLAEMRRAQGLVAATLDVEIGLHIAYCREWGLDETAITASPEAMQTVAYTR